MKGHKFMNYKHITTNERCCIANFLSLGLSLRKIAKHLNRNISTISREVKRNSTNGKYLAHIACENYAKNRKNCGAKGKSSNPTLIKYIEDGFNEKQKRSVIHKGDFLINIVGASIGRAAQFNLDCKANMNQAAALVRVNDSRVRDKYLLTYLNSDRAQRMYDSMKSDTGRANLSLQDISDLLILLPNVEQQIEFEMFANQVDKSKFAVQKTLEQTQTLFDSLMQKYFG